MPSSGSLTAPIITPRYLDIDGSRPAVVAEPLTPEAFAPFGSVISPGHLGADASNTAAANQGTAVKFIGVSHSRNLYSAAPSGKLPQQTNWNLFRCSPPTHLFSNEGEPGKRVYLAKVLEQHPYSSQTFLPLGRDATKPAYIVIVSLKDKGPQKLSITNENPRAPATAATSSSTETGRSSAVGSGPASMLTVELAAAAAAAAMALQQQQQPHGSDSSGSPAAEIARATAAATPGTYHQQQQQDHNGRFVAASYSSPAGKFKSNRKLHLHPL
ncbi:hypothetical protein D0Z00_003162 [Geotrichum galactomycetum]|uniref:Uncharacterized protein n=1 Tax=Geotrichum galactomycetum TaxID=27317 RepID=A0ACB6V261_9ASCO|nr:hypothetical protein D0Z00_003162 [Geotrichum candidum]